MALRAVDGDIMPVVQVAPNWESYEFMKLDLKNAEHQAFFEACSKLLCLSGMHVPRQTSISRRLLTIIIDALSLPHLPTPTPSTPTAMAAMASMMPSNNNQTSRNRAQCRLGLTMAHISFFSHFFVFLFTNELYFRV